MLYTYCIRMNRLTKNYFFSFIALGALLLFGFFYSEFQLQRNVADATIVNIAGRQRMLSQKIAKTTAELGLLSGDEEQEEVLQELEDALGLFERSHVALQEGDQEMNIYPNYSPTVYTMYNILGTDFSIIVEQGYAIVDARRLNSAADISEPSAKIFQVEDQFLMLMNDIVFAHENEANTRLLHSRQIVGLIFLSIIMFLVFLWAGIIAPGLKKSAQIDRAKSEFISLASHQLRTPLTATNWYTEMLLNGEAGRLTKKQKEFIQEVQHGGRRMADLVNALLNTSRIDLGTFPVTVEDVHVAQLVRDIVAEMKEQVDAKGLTLVLDIDSSITTAAVDPRLLRIIIENLVSNAIKYTYKGTVELTMRSTKHTLEISVKDSGMGIPEDEQSRVFSKLFRAENAAQSESEGTGLGLYIVKSIIDTIGGSIRFESVEDQGSTFSVSLPRKGMRSRKGEKQLI